MATGPLRVCRLIIRNNVDCFWRVVILDLDVQSCDIVDSVRERTKVVVLVCPCVCGWIARKGPEKISISIQMKSLNIPMEGDSVVDQVVVRIVERDSKTAFACLV